MEHRPTLFSRFKDAWNVFWGKLNLGDGPNSSLPSTTVPLHGKASSAKLVKQNGWLQGRILGKELVAELNESDLLPRTMKDGCWVVLSHDCDVTNSSFEKEPSVEVIFGEYLDRKDGNKLWGKNSRLLQMVEGERIYEFNVHLRNTFPRSFLVDHEPDSRKLSNAARLQLAGWLGRRYSRRGFADEFNNRSRSAVNALRNQLKPDGALISGIYLLVSDDELPEGTDYEIIVWVAMNASDYESEEKRTVGAKLLGMVEAQLNECQGIVVESSEVRSESEISIADIRKLKRWDFDDLTLRDEGPDALPCV